MSRLVISQSGLPLGDPHICSDSKNRLNIISAVYEPLISRIGPGEYQPNLCVAWHVDPNALLWDIRIRRNILFHDKSDVTAYAVAANLERIRDPKIGGAFGTQGVYASYIGGAKFHVLNKGRMRIFLREPIADLLDILAEMPIVSGNSLDELPDEQIGSGPYQIKDFDDEEIKMTAYEKHWKGKPKYQELYWKKQPEEEKINSIFKGEVDLATGITYEYAKIAESKNLDVIKKHGSLCIIFMLNCLQGVCKDKRIRQSLNYALDKKEIIEKVTNNTANLLAGPITPLHFGFNKEVKSYPYNPDKAKQLLIDAGYPDGLRLVMDIPSQMPDEAVVLSKLMAEQYEKVGIKLEIKIHRDRVAYSETVKAKKIGDLCCFDSSPVSTFRVLREKIHSPSRGPWWQGYSNVETDQLIERAQRTTDTKTRKNLYEQLHQIINEDAPWIYLYRPMSIWAKRPQSEITPSWDGTLKF